MKTTSSTLLRRTTSAVVVGSLLLCASALAGAGKEGYAKKFGKLDTDGDDRISSAEHAKASEIMFGKMDADSNGNVTLQEMSAHMASHEKTSGKSPKHASEKLKVIDRNADGMVSKAEHVMASQEMFAKLDRDNDGSLSKEEFVSGYDKDGDRHS